MSIISILKSRTTKTRAAMIIFLKKYYKALTYKYNRARVIMFSKGLKSFGKRSLIKFPVCFEGKENIDIGEDVTINAFVHIWGQGGVKIGNRVMIATHTAISSLTHDYRYLNMRYAPIISKAIIIEDDVWIGSNAVINPGIKIGRGAVVGAGSVVTKDVPENAIVVGVPAKVMKMREIEYSNEENTN